VLGGVLGERQVVQGVPAAQLAPLAGSLEPLEAVLTDRLEHRDAEGTGAVSAAQQALVVQRGHHVGCVETKLIGLAHRFDRLDRRSTREDGQAPEHRLLTVVEQLVAPVDRPTQGPLPFRDVPAAGEKREAPVEPGKDVSRLEQPNPRRRELDRQRQAVEPGADLGDRRRVLQRQVESRTDCPSALDEERDRIDRPQLVKADVTRAARERERRHEKLLLSGDPERFTARHEHLHARGPGDQLADGSGCGHDLLEIVQDEQERAVAQVLDECLEGVASRSFAQSERRRDSWPHELGIGDRRQRNEDRSIVERVRCLACDLHGQPRLAGAAWSGQRDDSFLGQELEQHVLLAGPADEARHLGREMDGTRVERPQRREGLAETGGNELEEMLGALEVLQAVLAEVAQRRAGRKRRRDEGPGCLRHEHLASVSRCRDSGRTVDIQPDVVVAAELAIAGVETHPDENRGLVRPRVLGKRSMGRDRRLDRLRGGWKDGKEAVALGPQLGPARTGDRTAHDPMVVLEKLAVAIPEGMDQARRTLDVAEQECDRAGRKDRPALRAHRHVALPAAAHPESDDRQCTVTHSQDGSH